MNRQGEHQGVSSEKSSPAGTSDEPKGQDMLQTDAEGAGSDATEFAEGGCNSQTDAQSNANEAAGSEATVNRP